MRSVHVVGAMGAAAVLAACGRGETLQMLQKQPAAVGLTATSPPLAPASGDGTGSTIALASLGSRRLAVVADADARVVRLLDVKEDHELPVTPLDGAPSQLVVARDGRVFVAVRDRAEVEVLEQAPGGEAALRVAARVSTADEPTAIALTPDGRTLLVTSGWGHALDAFATKTLEHRFRVCLAREPRAVVASEDGSRAYVAHAAASLVSVVDLDGVEHDVEAVALDAPDMLHDGRVQWRQGYALARTDIGVLAPGVTVETGDTTVRTSTYGGVDATAMPAEVFAVNLVHPHAAGGLAEADVPSRRLTPATAEGCILPRAAAYDASGQWLVVACQGQDAVWRVDARADGRRGRDQAWKVEGEPSGLAFDDERRALFVWSQRAHAVTALDLDAYHPSMTSEGDDARHVVTLGPRVGVPDVVARGRELFHATGDARISSDGRACASCHPDGRDDGLVWATPDGPRQTPTLAGRLAGTAPYGWNGSRSTVKKHVTNTLKRLGGTGLDDASMDALVAYCMTMSAAPRPAAVATAAVDPLAAEGQELFESERTGCASCHTSDGTFTDGNRHDVKSKSKDDPKRRFDTPSLRFVGGTAPYFHDGRYPTLRSLLVASDGKMGHTAQLSPHELDALEAYLRTL